MGGVIGPRLISQQFFCVLSLAAGDVQLHTVNGHYPRAYHKREKRTIVGFLTRGWRRRGRDDAGAVAGGEPPEAGGWAATHDHRAQSRKGGQACPDSNPLKSLEDFLWAWVSRCLHAIEHLLVRNRKFFVCMRCMRFLYVCWKDCNTAPWK